MEEIKRCFKCGIGFHRIGIISPEERLKDHEQTPHVIDCKECENHFVSDVHLKYHIEFYHDARCGDCCSFCDRTCSEQYAIKTELAGREEMEKGLTEKRDAVTDAEEELEHLIDEKTSNHMTVFEDIAKCVDVGFSGPEARYLSKSAHCKVAIYLSSMNGAIDGIFIQTAAAVTGHGAKNCLHSRKQLARLCH